MKSFARSDELIAPLLHVVVFVREQLKGGAIRGRNGGNGSLAQAIIGLPLEGGYPGIGDGDGILNRSGDSDSPFSDGRYRLNRGGEKFLRKTWRRLLPGGAGGCGGGNGKSDLVVLEGYGAVRNLSEGFDVDVGAAVDLDDCGLARLAVDDKGLRMRRGLRGDEDGQGKDNRQRKPGVEGLCSHHGVSYEDFVSV